MMRRGIVLGLIGAAAALMAFRAPLGHADDDEVVIDPTGPNAACYVCHITFVQEKLARAHLKAKVGCVDCHGTSSAHANDEHIGATKPDVTYPREEIADACRKCHPNHDVPPEAVIARWVELGRKAGAPAEVDRLPPVCTDCHGDHRIEHDGERTASAGPA
jgi:hypothetical protein